MPRRVAITFLAMAASALALLVPAAAYASPPSMPHATLLTSGLEGASGSTVGPGGALYVTEGATGTITRIDPRTGDTSTYATGLPPWIVGIGGAHDITFLGGTAYVLVTLVGPDVGGSDPVGIYRVDGPSSFTLIADLGQYSIDNPPETDYFVPSGVQYAIETYRDGFLVTDGHHNRVLEVTRDGAISEVMTFGNIVPTGLEVWGNTVYMAEAGPVPHLPEDGRIVSFEPWGATSEVVASGAPLLVDVERGRGATLYGLSQGIWTGGPEGSPASPDSGALVRVGPDGSFETVLGGLDRPTSVEFIGSSAYVVGLSGEVWQIHDATQRPFGR